MSRIEPFRVAVPEAELSELRARIRTTRWPDRETVSDWSQGVPLGYLRDLCAYWADGYDWRRCEDRLNRHPNFRAEIDGLWLHFVHVRSPEPDPLPLMMIHGWPSSILEFLDVIDPLARGVTTAGELHGDQVFDLVCPSLPGYGFSERPPATGWGVERIAAAFAALMSDLGYRRYGVHGGDWGASVATMLAQVDQPHCAAIHLTQPMVSPTESERSDVTPEERDALERRAMSRRTESGYLRLQATRPQTVGYGLVDSPALLAAWIVEKFRTWSDCDGDVESVFSRDELLDNVTLYWLTATGASSARLYWEAASMRYADPVSVPTGVTMFRGEGMQSSRRWVARRYRDLRFWSQPPRGGHFPALEQPDVLVRDLVTFFGEVAADECLTDG